MFVGGRRSHARPSPISHRRRTRGSPPASRFWTTRTRGSGCGVQSLPTCYAREWLPRPKCTALLLAGIAAAPRIHRLPTPPPSAGSRSPPARGGGSWAARPASGEHTRRPHGRRPGLPRRQAGGSRGQNEKERRPWVCALLGAKGGTRTPTGCPARSLVWCVYQFRHLRDGRGELTRPAGAIQAPQGPNPSGGEPARFALVPHPRGSRVSPT